MLLTRKFTPPPPSPIIKVTAQKKGWETRTNNYPTWLSWWWWCVFWYAWQGLTESCKSFESFWFLSFAAFLWCLVVVGSTCVAEGKCDRWTLLQGFACLSYLCVSAALLGENVWPWAGNWVQHQKWNKWFWRKIFDLNSKTNTCSPLSAHSGAPHPPNALACINRSS